MNLLLLLIANLSRLPACPARSAVERAVGRAADCFLSHPRYRDAYESEEKTNLGHPPIINNQGGGALSFGTSSCFRKLWILM